MKKLNYLLLGLAGLTLASCSQDDLQDPSQQGNGNCRLIVSIPKNVATRSFGDAITANTLWVGVYDQDNNLAQDPFTVSFNESPTLTTTVDLNLPTGQKYNIALFAVADEAYNSVYVFDWDNATFDVNYKEMGYVGTNADYYDCFYKLQPVTVGTTQFTETVLLTRPIAKVNWGTSEFEAGNKSVQNAFGATGGFIRTNFTAKDVYYQFSLLNSDVVEGKVTNVDFEGWAAPSSGWIFPNVSETTTYTYVAQQFLLAPDASTTYDLQLTINNDGNTEATYFENDIVVASAPVEANYQTNIYGALLTDNVNFEVKKDDKWNTPDYSVVIGAEEPTKDPEGNYLITNQAELTWVAQQVNGTSTSTRASDDPRTASYKLANDIYMVGNWTPIGIDFAHRFGGSFDGQGYTIHNLYVNSNDRTGLFGFMNGQIENLNFDNATIISNHWAGVVAGFSDNETGSTYIKNCKVTNSSVTLSPEQVNGKWDNGDKGGLIIGYMVTKDQVTGCTVENCTLQGYRDLGGIIGYANGSVITNNTVNGLTITVNKAQNYEGYTQDSQYDANNVIGHFVQGTYGQDSGNTSSNVSIEYGIYVNSNESLSSVIKGAQAGETINIEKGIYDTFPSNPNMPEGVIIDCEEGTEFTGANSSVNLNGATVKGATFNYSTRTSNDGSIKGTINANFENCTFTGGNGARWTYAGSKEISFTDCKFGGTAIYAFHIDGLATGVTESTLLFNECEFDGFLAIASTVNTIYDNCNFAINSTSKYGGGNFWGNSTFNNCNFYLPDPTVSFQYIALATAGKTYVFDNCYNEGELITTNFPFDASPGVTVTCNGTSKTF